MKTYIALFVTTAASWMGFNLYAGRTQPPKDDRLGSIVRLVADGRTFCTGIVVNDSTVITASHCILVQTPFGGMMNKDPIEIRDDSNEAVGVYGKAYQARVQLDQGLIMGDFTKFRKRKTMTNVGELNKIARYDQVLLSCGYPMGGPLHCNNLYFKELYDFMWATNGLLVPGMSGGPVMLEDGTVVALNVAVERNFSLVSPIYNLDMSFK